MASLTKNTQSDPVWIFFSRNFLTKPDKHHVPLDHRSRDMLWIRKGVSATLKSGRYTLSYSRGRRDVQPMPLSTANYDGGKKLKITSRLYKKEFCFLHLFIPKG